MRVSKLRIQSTGCGHRLSSGRESSLGRHNVSHFSANQTPHRWVG